MSKQYSMPMDEIRERVLERFRHDGKGRRYVTREELDARSVEVYGRWAARHPKIEEVP